MEPLLLFQHDPNLVAFDAGQTVFSEGDPADGMYVIVEGAVEIRFRGHVLDVLEPGELFGEMAILDAKPRSATAVVVAPSRLARIDQKRFLYLVQNTPYFAVHVMRVMTERLRRDLSLIPPAP